MFLLLKKIKKICGKLGFDIDISMCMAEIHQPAQPRQRHAEKRTGTGQDVINSDNFFFFERK